MVFRLLGGKGSRRWRTGGINLRGRGSRGEASWRAPAAHIPRAVRAWLRSLVAVRGLVGATGAGPRVALRCPPAPPVVRRRPATHRPRYVRGYCAVDKSQPRKQPERAKGYKVWYSTVTSTVPVPLGRAAGVARISAQAIARVLPSDGRPEPPPTARARRSGQPCDYS